MMQIVGSAAAFLVGGAAVFYAARRFARERRLRERLLGGRAAEAPAESGPVFRPEALPGLMGAVQRRLRQAAFRGGAPEFLAVAGLCGVAGAMAVRPLGLEAYWMILGSSVGAYLPWSVVSWVAAWRLRKLEAQLADAIDLMVGALRSGVGIRQSMELVRAEKKGPIRREFDELLAMIDVGIPAPKAFGQWSLAIGSPILDTFAIAMGTKWDTGGNYADMLLNLAARIRDSIRLRRRVQALTGEAKITAVFALVIPYALAAFLLFSNPAHFEAFRQNPSTSKLLFAAAMMQVVAVLWIKRMIRVLE